MQLLTVLEDDLTLADGGALDVVVPVVGQAGRRAGVRVVLVDIQRAVLAIAVEVDRVAMPHGKVVRAGPVGDLVDGAGGEVRDPDLLGHAALVAFPGARLARDPVVGEFIAVGREAGQAAAVNGQALGHAAVDRDQEHLLEQIGMFAARAKQHVLAVGMPAEDAVTRRVEGQPPGLAAGRGHDVHVVAAVVAGGEGDPLVVGAELCPALVALMARHAVGGAAVLVHEPEIALVGEHDGLGAHIGALQQEAFVGNSRRTRQDEHGADQHE